MTISTTIAPLFQEDPEPGDRYNARGWKTWRGHDYESRKHRSILLLNAKLSGKPYEWLVTINIVPVLTVAEHKAVWPKVARNLRRQGIVCHGVREVTRTSQMHYHLLVPTGFDQRQLKQAFNSAFPSEFNTPAKLFRVAIERVKSQFGVASYVVKAKVPTDYTNDLYRDKRILFAKIAILDKLVTVGDFWVESRPKLWQRIIARERSIAEHQGSVAERAANLHALIDGYLPLNMIVRNLCLQLIATASAY